MAENLQNMEETTTRTGNTVHTTTAVNNPQAESDHKLNVAERVVWFIGGVVLILLAFRFLLSLLGAHASNGFANFIYSISHPFVAPFFSLFNYNKYSYGVSHFEIYTLFAMAFYAVLTWGITKLVTIKRD